MAVVIGSLNPRKTCVPRRRIVFVLSFLSEMEAQLGRSVNTECEWKNQIDWQVERSFG